MFLKSLSIEQLVSTLDVQAAKLLTNLYLLKNYELTAQNQIHFLSIVQTPMTG